MSRFSNALARALELAGISQIEFCDLTGIGQSPMSRYVRGTGEVGPKVAEKIIRALPSPHDAEVLAAYLADEIPASDLEPLVILRANVEPRVQEDPEPALPDNLPRELRAVLTYFAKKAVAHPEIRDMLFNLRTALEAE